MFLQKKKKIQDNTQTSTASLNPLFPTLKRTSKSIGSSACCWWFKGRRTKGFSFFFHCAHRSEVFYHWEITQMIMTAQQLQSLPLLQHLFTETRLWSENPFQLYTQNVLHVFILYYIAHWDIMEITHLSHPYTENSLYF